MENNKLDKFTEWMYERYTQKTIEDTFENYSKNAVDEPDDPAQVIDLVLGVIE